MPDMKPRTKTVIGYCSPSWYQFFRVVPKDFVDPFGRTDNRIMFPNVRARKKDRYGKYPTKLEITIREIPYSRKTTVCPCCKGEGEHQDERTGKWFGCLNCEGKGKVII